jgi:selenocysteine lyase/cysteine desulfurase
VGVRSKLRQKPPATTGVFDELRAREFARLDQQGIVYLDYTGSAISPASLVHQHAEFLSQTVLGNPHSENPASILATTLVDEARSEILDFFDADPAEYAVCFTANATAALRLVGESFPFGPRSRFILSADNHNSVNGIREFAKRRGARVKHLPLDEELRPRLDQIDLPTATAPSLFAFPAQSNFSGVQHPLSLVSEAQDRGYQVVLDAAAFVATNPLSLRDIQPDFVCISFYKMFGYPTGVGALLARRDALARLEPPWFAGGTVEYVSVQNDIYQRWSGPEGYEEGTPNFLSISAVPAGLRLLRSIGLDEIHRHVLSLTERALEGLLGLVHPDGSPKAQVYGPRSIDRRGGTIPFNVIESAGHVTPSLEVEREAAQRGICLRAGCFCNPGASEVALGFDADDACRCLESFAPGTFTHERFSECMGSIPVGAMRASMGLANNNRDIDRLLAFVDDFAATSG